MMKRIFVTLILCAAALFRAEAQEQIPIDPAKMPPMRMLFTQTITNARGKVLSEAKGTLDLQYPNFYITIGNFRFFGNDTIIWCQDVKNDEVTISKSIVQQMLNESDMKQVGKTATLGYTAKDGTRHDFTLTEAELMNEKWPESHFKLTDDKIGENTIVTDMR